MDEDKPPQSPAPPPRKALLTEEQAQKIIAALAERGVDNYNCARCGSAKFNLAPGITHLRLQDPGGPAGLLLGGPTIPSAVVICERCGLVFMHALGTLGLTDGGKITL